MRGRGLRGEGAVWSLLCNYLAAEFRGTSDSLKELLKDQQQVEVMRGGGSMEPALQLPGEQVIHSRSSSSNCVT